MTLGQSTAVAMALVSAVALGIWISPFVLEPSEFAQEPAVAAYAAPEPAAPEPAARADRAADVTAIAAVPVNSAALHARLQPLLNRGARMELAAAGFESAEQFAAVAYAAHNTGVPFVLLKHRVLEEGRTLADAIAESDESIDADAEAGRARSEARAVIATLSASTT